MSCRLLESDGGLCRSQWIVKMGLVGQESLKLINLLLPVHRWCHTLVSYDILYNYEQSWRVSQMFTTFQVVETLLNICRLHLSSVAVRNLSHLNFLSVLNNRYSINSKKIVASIIYNWCSNLIVPCQQSWLGAIGMGSSVRSSIRPSVCHTFWFLCISGQTAQGTNIKLGGHVHYGTPQIWLTFGYAPVNFCCVIASDWWSSFRAFANKGKLIMGLPRPD